eukprot:m.276182 g.276182  ORF g.276182 m.276182 type:complete len:72 (-) comp79904_c0_seq1:98-313(-)
MLLDKFSQSAIDSWVDTPSWRDTSDKNGKYRSKNDIMSAHNRLKSQARERLQSIQDNQNPQTSNKKNIVDT